MESNNSGLPGTVKGAAPQDEEIVRKQMVLAASEVMVAIAEEADSMIQRSVNEVLGLLRGLVKLDVVFFSKFTPDHQVVRNAVTPPDRPVVNAGDVVPYSHSLCKRVMDGELPSLIPDYAALARAKNLPEPAFPIGTYMSAPVLLVNGEIYGTLCSISFQPKEGQLEQDHAALKAVATLLSSHVQRAIV